jgi:hypothetical protein
MPGFPDVAVLRCLISLEHDGPSDSLVEIEAAENPPILAEYLEQRCGEHKEFGTVTSKASVMTVKFALISSASATSPFTNVLGTVTPWA